MRANGEPPSTPTVAARPGGQGPAKLTLARVNPFDHGSAIKELFVTHERPEFPDYFERAYPDAVADGGTSWIGWDQHGRLCAHIAQFPREFSFNARRVQGALLANLMVASEYRTFWPALALARRAVKDLKEAGTADFIYADPNDRARPVLLAAGFREIGVLRRFVLPLTDGRRPINLALRLYHLLRWFRTTPLVGIERRASEMAETADATPTGDVRALRPVRRASLYRGRLAGYPGAGDCWYTFHRRGRDTTPVGEALVRGMDRDGVALVCVVQCEPLKVLRSLLATLAHSLTRAGARRLEIWIMEGSHAATAARRAGFIPRPESVPVLAQPLTVLGAEAMAAGREWQILAVDLDR